MPVYSYPAAASMGGNPGKEQAAGSDDVAQRLQRIEALAEEIARAQVRAKPFDGPVLGKRDMVMILLECKKIKTNVF